MERLILIWDDLDDWLNVARHLLLSLLPFLPFQID
jgi:hypothetical protein